MNNDLIIGGTGPSAIAPGTASVVVDGIVNGTEGDDTFFVYRARAVPLFDPSADYGRVLMYGNGGNDHMTATHGNDVLTGGRGNDTLVGGYGNDILDGGADSDTVDYGARLGGGGGFPNNGNSIWHLGHGVNVNLEFGVGETRDPDSGEFDTLISIENALGTAWSDVLGGSEENNTLDGRGGNDYIFGWGGRDDLRGGDGDDIMSGGAGGDTLAGGGGNDFLQGNEGFDLASYRYSAFSVHADLANGFGLATGGVVIDYDTFSNIEGVLGSDHDDAIYGNGADNDLIGFSGDDWIFGGSGADDVDGGNGDDYLVGGAGEDQIYGGLDTDTVDYSESTAGVQIDLAAGTGLGGDAGGDILYDIENAWGTGFADSLSGTAAGNQLFGFDGGDTLRGLDGRDVLVGGAGADVLDGGAETDWASYETSLAGVSVNLATGAGAGGDAAGDTLIGIENVRGSEANDTLRAGAAPAWLAGYGGIDILVGGGASDGLYGGLGNDRLSGNGGADRLAGEEGRDTIAGGLGDDYIDGGHDADSLTGGAGADTFFYLQASDSNAAFGRDTIRDFSVGVDTIDLEQIDAILNLIDVDNAFSFIGAAAFISGASGQLRFQQAGANTLIQGETNGLAGADIEILLAGNHLLTADDFIL